MSQMIYLADDEKNIRDLMEAALTEEGFSVKTFPDGKTLLDVCGEKMPDLVILDVMMPGTDGFSACSGASERGSGSPYSYLFRESSPYDRVTGLNLGSDDYLVKPFLPLELVARIRAILRRSHGSRPAREEKGQRLVFGGLSVTPAEDR